MNKYIKRCHFGHLWCDAIAHTYSNNERTDTMIADIIYLIQVYTFLSQQHEQDLPFPNRVDNVDFIIDLCTVYHNYFSMYNVYIMNRIITSNLDTHKHKK